MPIIVDDLCTILIFRDHIFDTVARKRRKPKRKFGDVGHPDLAARGVTGVREHHKRNETKILPHIRLGIELPTGN